MILKTLFLIIVSIIRHRRVQLNYSICQRQHDKIELTWQARHMCRQYIFFVKYLFRNDGDKVI